MCIGELSLNERASTWSQNVRPGLIHTCRVTTRARIYLGFREMLYLGLISTITHGKGYGRNDQDWWARSLALSRDIQSDTL